MHFSEGDKVRLKQTGELGEIVGIIDNFFLEVIIEGDKESIPVAQDQVEYPHHGLYKKHQESKKKKIAFVENLKVESRSQAREHLDKGLYLVFRPIFREVADEEIINRFDLFLLNQNDALIKCRMNISIKNKQVFAHELEMTPGQDSILYTLSFEETTDNPIFSFNVQTTDQRFFFDKKLTRKKLNEFILNMQANELGLFKWKLTNLEQKQEHFVLTEDMIQDMKSGPYYATEKPIKNSQTAKSYIDLHIEEIFDKPQLLSSDEIFEFQLNYFQKELDLAWADQEIDVFTVVHGMGEGILQKHIKKICNRTSFVADCKIDFKNPGQSLIYFRKGL